MMVRSLQIIFLVVPAMALSFYITNMVMQNPQLIASLQGKNPVSVGSASFAAISNPAVEQKAQYSENLQLLNPSETVAQITQDVETQAPQAITPVDQAMVTPPVRSVAPTKLENAPQVIAQNTAAQNTTAQAPVVAVSQQNSNVSEDEEAVQLAAASSSDPYNDEVDPNDVNHSILVEASTKSSWSDALVTSAFKAYRSKDEERKKAESAPVRAAALTPRILPSGRAFGGFTESEFQKRELRCMATALYFEARSEPVRGQLAVGQVIMNRVRSPDYPDTICGVIFQGDHRRTGCQFSFACDGKTDRPSNEGLWQRSQKLATDLTQGRVWLKDIANSTHYHADYVHPKWRRSMRRLKKIGRHIFYKSPKISTTATFQAVRS